MIDIIVDLLQWFIIFLVKKTLGRTIQKEIIQNEVLAKNYENQ